MYGNIRRVRIKPRTRHARVYLNLDVSRASMHRKRAGWSRCTMYSTTNAVQDRDETICESLQGLISLKRVRFFLSSPEPFFPPGPAKSCQLRDPATFPSLSRFSYASRSALENPTARRHPTSNILTPPLLVLPIGRSLGLARCSALALALIRSLPRRSPRSLRLPVFAPIPLLALEVFRQ